MKRTGAEIAKIRARKDVDFEAGVWNGVQRHFIRTGEIRFRICGKLSRDVKIYLQR